MSTIHLNQKAIHTFGECPAIGSDAPVFHLSKTDLSEVSLEDYANQKILLNVYPSLDTGVCFSSVKRFSKEDLQKKGIVVLCVSMDLPFALKRIAEGECFENVTLLSDFRNREFGDAYGLTIADGPIAGLLARAVLILNKQHKITYCQLVDEISHEPDYDAALKSLELDK